jgi:replication factor C subunit 1
MDEVDGMGAGDRSGMSELISVIKNSRIPIIICICNDRQSQKMKSSLPYCMDLRCKRPVKSIIARRAIRIGEMEGMQIEQNAAEAIAESCGNDIRQILNCLQMWSSSKTGGKSVTYKALRERQSSINKDEILRVSMFDATKQIIEGRRGLSGADRKAAKASLMSRSDAFFVDYSLIGINVHQNYLKVMVGGYQDAVRCKDDDKMEAFVNRMHDATLAMSDFAVGEQAVRGGDQNWSLLPFLSMMTVKTGYHAGGENGGFIGGFPEFAGWMGKNSTRGRSRGC